MKDYINPIIKSELDMLMEEIRLILENSIYLLIGEKAIGWKGQTTEQQWMLDRQERIAYNEDRRILSMITNNELRPNNELVIALIEDTKHLHITNKEKKRTRKEVYQLIRIDMIPMGNRVFEHMEDL